MGKKSKKRHEVDSFLDIGLNIFTVIENSVSMKNHQNIENSLKKYSNKFVVDGGVFSSAKVYCENSNLDFIPKELFNNLDISDISITKSKIKKIKDIKLTSNAYFNENKITSIENFDQNGYSVSFESNNIKVIKNFIHSGDVNLNNNPISNLDGFLFDKNYKLFFNGIIVVQKNQSDLIQFLELNNIKYVYSKYKKVV